MLIYLFYIISIQEQIVIYIVLHQKSLKGEQEMKKDVSYGQIIRKGILSILAILFFLGCLSFGYAVTKNLLDSAEAENVELESNSSVPNISEEVLEESLPDSLADSELGEGRI